MTDRILETKDLKTHFAIRAGLLRKQVGEVLAVDGVNIYVNPQETLGVVGESGCGKTTLGRSILRLVEPTSGQVLFRGEDVTLADKDRLRELRREMQIVFQDPYASLNPRMPVRDIIGEPMRIHGASKDEANERVADLLTSVGLMPDHGNRYPHEFSGGQRQRIGIARALALDPTLIILDEPVSALDVSIQAQVLNLLESIQDRLDLSYIFIAHDLSVVRHISDRVAVMYLGRVVETADRNEIYTAPAHPYTISLLSAVPVADPNVERRRRRILLEGDLPSLANPPSGCRFHTRCPIAEPVCSTDSPELVLLRGDHEVACHFPIGPDETLEERVAVTGRSLRLAEAREA